MSALVSEKQRSRVVRSFSGSKQLLSFLLAVLMLNPIFATGVFAAPMGENTVVGTPITVDRTDPANVQITTFDPDVVVNWTSFDIANGERVAILQPGVAARLLNQIQGATPTQIDGELFSNGQVYIVNPAGVFFGAMAMVDVASLVAAAADTLDPTEALDWANRMTNDQFDLVGEVSNEGDLSADSPRGVYLLGRLVRNSGTISAPDGAVVIVAGEQVVIGDPSAGVFVVLNSLGGPAEAQNAIVNSGALDAGPTGVVDLRVGDIYSTAFNLGGTTTAQDVKVSAESGKGIVSGDVFGSSSVDLQAAGDLDFDPTASQRIGGDSILLRAGDGTTGTAAVQLLGVAGSTVFEGSGGAGTSPSELTQRQDAAIADAAAEFGGGPAGVAYTLQSDQGSVTVATAANVAGSDLTVNGTGATAVDLIPSLNLASLTANGNTVARGALSVSTDVTITGDLEVAGDGVVPGDLVTDGDAIAASWIVGGLAQVGGNFVSTVGEISVSLDATVVLNLTAKTDASAASWSVTGSASTGQALRSVTGSTTVGGAGTVGGDLDSALDASAASWSVTGSAMTGQDLKANAGAVTIGGAATVGRDLTGTTDAKITGVADVERNVEAGGSAEFGSNATVGGNVTAKTGVVLMADLMLDGPGAQTVDGGETIEFGGAGAQTVDSTISDVTLRTSTPGAEQFSSIFKSSGDLNIKGNADVLTVNKVTVSAGSLTIEGKEVRVSDLNADTIKITAASIILQGRTTGLAFEPTGGLVTDRGVDFNANFIDFNVVPATEGGGQFTFGTPDGDNLSDPILGAAVSRRSFRKDGGGFVVDGRQDLTPEGAGTDNPDEADAIPTLAELAIQQTVPELVDAGGTTGPVRAEDMVAFLECVRLEGDTAPRPADCPEEYVALAPVGVPPVGAPGPGAELASAGEGQPDERVGLQVVLARPIGHPDRPPNAPQLKALQIYRRLKSEPVVPTLEQAVQIYQAETGVDEVRGGGLRRYLEASEQEGQQQALRYLNEMRGMLAELRIAGMTPPQFLRAAKRVLVEMAPAGLSAAELGVAVEGGAGEAGWPSLWLGLITAVDELAPWSPSWGHGAESLRHSAFIVEPKSR